MSFPERIASYPVLLRMFTLADAPRVAELCGDWEVARMTALIPHPYSLEMAESFIGALSRGLRERTGLTYAIARADDGLLVGAIGITSSPEAGDSLGYWIGRPHWGNGYATAAARAMMALAFSRLGVDMLHGDPSRAQSGVGARHGEVRDVRGAPRNATASRRRRRNSACGDRRGRLGARGAGG